MNLIDFLTQLENGIGLEISAWFNRIGATPLRIILSPFHYLGSEIGFLVLLSSLYWAYDKNFGRRLTIILLSAQYFSIGLKEALTRPRPFHVAPERFNPISEYTQPGLPSGHTISGTVTGIAFIRHSRNSTNRLLWFLFILVMGLSRLVHGVHYPQDVLAGWIVGTFWAFSYLPLERFIVKISGNWRLRTKLTIAAGASAVLIALILDLPIAFEVQKNFLSVTGVLAGTFIGIIIENSMSLFSTQNVPSKQRLIRLAIGFVSLFGIYVLLKISYDAVLAESQTLTAQIIYTLRYALVGIWATFGAPWLFRRFESHFVVSTTV